MEKTFWGENFCSCAFGANIRSYTKQRARHGTPFLQPPPLLRRASMSPPPPPPQSNFQVAQGLADPRTHRNTALRPRYGGCSKVSVLWQLQGPYRLGPPTRSLVPWTSPTARWWAVSYRGINRVRTPDPFLRASNGGRGGGGAKRKDPQLETSLRGGVQVCFDLWVPQLPCSLFSVWSKSGTHFVQMI